MQEAYGLLVEGGYIEARPKSGYFVLARRLPPLPDVSQPPSNPHSIPDWYKNFSLIDDLSQPQLLALHIAIGDHQAPTLKPLRRLLGRLGRSASSAAFDYELIQGNDALRQQIARLMLEGGARVGVEDIIISSGCQEALMCSLRALTQPGDVVAVDSPNFFGAIHAIEACGLKVLEIPTHAHSGIRLKALAQALERWPVKVCLLTPSNNNPLGYSMADADKPKLLELLSAHDIALIEDDIYGDLSDRLPRPRTIKSYDTEGRVILCSSFSKTVAGGLRVGWICAGRYHDQVMMMKYTASMGTASLTQQGLAEFIAQGYYQKHLRKMRHQYRRDRDKAIAWLTRYLPEGTRISSPQGGYLLWIEFDSAIDTLELNRRAIEQGIKTAPGVMFSATDKYRNCLRINCRNSEDPRLHAAIQRLGEIAARLLVESMEVIAD